MMVIRYARGAAATVALQIPNRHRGAHDFQSRPCGGHVFMLLVSARDGLWRPFAATSRCALKGISRAEANSKRLDL